MELECPLRSLRYQRQCPSRSIHSQVGVVMPCTLCRETPKNWEGGERRCAFPNGVFVSENWNCETMNRLRILEEDQIDSNVCHSEDQKAVLLDTDPESDPCKFVLLCWYKNRGRTDQAFLLGGEGTQPLTIRAAEATLAFHQDELTGADFVKTAYDIESYGLQKKAAMTLMKPLKDEDS